MKTIKHSLLVILAAGLAVTSYSAYPQTVPQLKLITESSNSIAGLEPSIGQRSVRLVSMTNGRVAMLYSRGYPLACSGLFSACSEQSTIWHGVLDAGGLVVNPQRTWESLDAQTTFNNGSYFANHGTRFGDGSKAVFALGHSSHNSRGSNFVIMDSSASISVRGGGNGSYEPIACAIGTNVHILGKYVDPGRFQVNTWGNGTTDLGATAVGGYGYNYAGVHSFTCGTSEALGGPFGILVQKQVASHVGISLFSVNGGSWTAVGAEARATIPSDHTSFLWSWGGLATGNDTGIVTFVDNDIDGRLAVHYVRFRITASGVQLLDSTPRVLFRSNSFESTDSAVTYAGAGRYYISIQNSGRAKAGLPTNHTQGTRVFSLDFSTADATELASYEDTNYSGTGPYVSYADMDIALSCDGGLYVGTAFDGGTGRGQLKIFRLPVASSSCSTSYVPPSTITSLQVDRVHTAFTNETKLCKGSFPDPQCRAWPYDTSANLAYQGNGFAAPAVAKTSLTDVAPGYSTIHKPEYANDGRYGNGSSWIPDQYSSSWIKLDLGRVVEFSRVDFGRDRTYAYDDRDPLQFEIAVSNQDDVYANGNESNDDSEYLTIFRSNTLGYSGMLLMDETVHAMFPAVSARFVRIRVENLGTAIDEIEVFAPATTQPREVPSISKTIVGTQGTNGWYTSSVSVDWLVDTHGYPELSRQGCNPTSVNSDTSGTDVSCTVTTTVGTSTEVVSIKRDATAPVATTTPSPLPNSAGWNNGSVSTAFTGTDATSGIAFCSATDTVATEGESQTSISGTCTDNAGNISAAVNYSPINIDLTTPSVSGSRSPAANGAGWNIVPVTISFSGTDTLSGVAVDGCSVPQVLSANGAGQSTSGVCTDLAGNSASAIVSGINIDTVAPVAHATISPAPNLTNWHRSPVTVSFSGTDSISGSGVASCSTEINVATDGANQNIFGGCTDVAGNISTKTSATVNLDQIAPAITVTAPANGASYVQNAAANAAFGCIDALSGVNNCSGTVPPGTAFSTSTLGANLFTVQTTDVAGNSATRTVSYTVVAPSPFTVSPTTLAFGSQVLNSGTAQLVTVRNNTAAALALSAPTITGTNSNQFTLARTCGTSLTANASCTITVTFRPTTAGPKIASFSFRIGTTTQSISLSGTGVAATYTLTPTAITFPSTTRNTNSTSQRITIANTSSVTMPLTTIALGGTNANQFVKTQTCGTSIAASNSCFVDLSFKPTSAGSKSATLTVTPGGGATAKSVTLKGTGL